MIKLPVLDDQKYDDIVNNARLKIPKLLPEWTNFNVHDPGITLIELLSWLKEMQQYHMDQITDKNKLKFLKLLGCQPIYIRPADAGVIIGNNSHPFALPVGSRFFAGDICFEARCKTQLTGNAIKKIMVYDGSGINDVSGIQKELDMSFYAFGEVQTPGSYFKIGFDGVFLSGKTYRLWFSVYDNYHVKRNPVKQGESPMLNHVVWEMLKEGEWVPVKSIKDRTNGFLNSGYVEFCPEADSEIYEIDGCLEELSWFRIRLERPGCEESPKISGIYTNYVPARQIRTLSEVHEFDITEGENRLCVETCLSLFGAIELQLETPTGGWSLLNSYDESIRIERNFIDGICNISYMHIPVEDSSTGARKCRLRVLCLDNDFSADRIIGSSNGMPHQKFSTKYIGRLIRDDALIQVAERDRHGNITYYDWSFTDEIDIAEGNKKAFSIDNKKMEIAFGDNENGLIPAAGEMNIFFAACSISEGESGNINSYEINNIFDYGICTGGNGGELEIYNIDDCSGGLDDETMEEAVARLRKELEIPSRAVTTSDFEYVVRSTPGLRISDVKAVPQSTRGNVNVSVIVIPYSSKPRPKPDKEYMEIIRQRLEKYRLIGSTISVIEPHYIEISVYAEIVPEFYTETIVEDIINKLDNYFNSQDDNRFSGKIGEPVYESDIISYINSLQYVSYVKRISLSAKGNGWRKAPGGDIYIPYNAVVCSGNHEIEIQEF
jgi:Uncharacterized homolog of phage Mu protein gp47